MYGVQYLPKSSQLVFENTTAVYIVTYFVKQGGVQNLATTINVTKVVSKGRRNNLRDLQTSILTVFYNQTLFYRSNTNLDASKLATLPFSTQSDRSSYVQVLKGTADAAFSGLTGVSSVSLATPAPSSSPTHTKTRSPTRSPVKQPEPTNASSQKSKVLSQPAIIGIAVGGGIFLLCALCFLWSMCSKKDTGYSGGVSTGDPPNELKVPPPGQDDISTLDAPLGHGRAQGPESIAGYGDQR